VQILIVENVPPHAGVSLNGDLSLKIQSGHSADDFFSRWKLPGIVGREKRTRLKQE
jgi:hypothetical protein